jgi:hypothetical protein
MIDCMNLKRPGKENRKQASLGLSLTWAKDQGLKMGPGGQQGMPSAAYPSADGYK